MKHPLNFYILFPDKHEWRPSNLVFPTSRKTKNSQRPKDFTFLSPFLRLHLRPRHVRPLLYPRHRFVPNLNIKHSDGTGFTQNQGYGKMRLWHVAQGDFLHFLPYLMIFHSGACWSWQKMKKTLVQPVLNRLILGTRKSDFEYLHTYPIRHY